MPETQSTKKLGSGCDSSVVLVTVHDRGVIEEVFYDELPSYGHGAREGGK